MSRLKTFQKNRLLPQPFLYSSKKALSKSHTWFAFTTLPKLASFSGKGRNAGVYLGKFFKGFATTRAKKNLRGASAVILFSEKIL